MLGLLQALNQLVDEDVQGRKILIALDNQVQNWCKNVSTNFKNVLHGMKLHSTEA